MKKWLEERLHGKRSSLHVHFQHSNLCGSSVWELGTKKGQTLVTKKHMEKQKYIKKVTFPMKFM
jgi:hypothetical protein